MPKIAFLDLLALIRLVRLAWPVILSRLGIMVMGLTDSVVVGQYSAYELSRHALGWAPTFVVITTGIGLLLGVQVMTARFYGEGRLEETGAVLRRGVVYALQLGVVAVLGLLWLGPVILNGSGVEAALAQGALGPLNIFALSLIPYMVSVCFSFFLEAVGRPKPSMTAIWIANGINLILNLWLVPGGFGLAPLGAEGSAWATFGSRLLLCVLLFWIVARLPEAKAFGIFQKPRSNPSVSAEQRRLGYGAGASYFIEVAAFAGMTLFAGRLGQTTVGAWTVVLSVASFIFMFPLGLSSATAVLVGRAYGAGDGRGVARAGRIAFGFTTCLMLLISLAVALGHGLIARAYVSDPQVVSVASGAILWATLFYMTDGLQVVGGQALRARGEVWVPTMMHLFSYGVVMLPLGFVLSNLSHLGVNGMVFAIIAASLVSAILLCGRFMGLKERL